MAEPKPKTPKSTPKSTPKPTAAVGPDPTVITGAWRSGVEVVHGSDSTATLAHETRSFPGSCCHVVDGPQKSDCPYVFRSA